MPRSPKQMQAVTEAPPKAEQIIRIVARTDVGFEHHLNLPESAVRDLLDPEVADAYIEVPVPPEVRGVKKRYLHTSRIAEIDLCDELPPESDEAPIKGDTGSVKAVKPKTTDANRGG